MTPFRFNPSTGELQISGSLRRAVGAAARFWQQVRENGRRSFGLDPSMSWHWPRWIFLRATGVFGILAFLSWAGDIEAYFGPTGLFPGGDLERAPGLAGFVTALGNNPSLFLLTSATWLPKALVGAGLLASISLVVNVLPKASLIVAWLCYLSLCAPSRALSGFQLDPLQLEIFFLSIFVAPSGLRPGLATDQPASRFGLLLIRLTALKVMLGSGLCKFTTGDAYWWSFTAMERLYETAPFPALLGYHSHLMPHWYHVGETLFMMAAEIGAPLVLLFCGKRAKLAALAVWSAFQLGIEANCNFAWLNLAGIGAAVALLDDGFLISVFPKLARSDRPARARAPLTRAVTTLALSLSLCASLASAPHLMLPDETKIPAFIDWLNVELSPLMVGNPLGLYRHMNTERHVIVVEGSADDGKTWREYRYRVLPQNLRSMSPYHAPLLARFDNAMHVAALAPQIGAPLLHSLARRLTEGRPEIAALFLENPFPDKPPGQIRYAAYTYALTTAAELHETGRYWNRQLVNIWPSP